MGKHSVAEAESQLSALIDRALAGDEVVITRHGTPVVEIRAVAKRAKVLDRAAVDWLRQHLVVPQKPFSENAADLIRRMRDEDWQ